jgi:thiamine-phosphate pyrophosphorylase
MAAPHLHVPVMLPRLHILTDTTLQRRYTHLDLARMAFAAGRVAVQYRNKDFQAARDLAELRAIADLARDHGRILLINDDAHLALQVGAAGVHLGRTDMGVAEARAYLGPAAIIGATVHNAGELYALRGQGADYYGIGPVFGTTSKDTGLPALGCDGLAVLAPLADRPVIAIGSIDGTRTPQVLAAGAYGIAVISAYCMADDPTATAQALLQVLAQDHP